MSENLDLVRSINADWERGDFSAVEWADPEIEFSIVGGPSPTSGAGLTEGAKAMSGFLDPWKEFRSEAEEIRELDCNRVLMLSHPVAGRGRTSGLELEQMMPRGGATLFEIRDGKVTRLISYWDRDDALADLGLAE
jgi:ketosteroid isomerase-like protein